MKEDRGLEHEKFTVIRKDWRDVPGQDHVDDVHFVLNLTTDEHARAALLAYIRSCRDKFPKLAADLERLFGKLYLLHIDYSGKGEGRTYYITARDRAHAVELFENEHSIRAAHMLALREPVTVDDLVEEVGHFAVRLENRAQLLTAEGWLIRFGIGRIYVEE